MCSPSADHALRFRGPINNLHEAPVLGNGDLAAMVQVSQHEFRLHLGKQDVYDARCEVLAAARCWRPTSPFRRPT